jgi:hypothetical protein
MTPKFFKAESTQNILMMQSLNSYQNSSINASESILNGTDRIDAIQKLIKVQRSKSKVLLRNKTGSKFKPCQTVQYFDDNLSNGLSKIINQNQISSLMNIN